MFFFFFFTEICHKYFTGICQCLNIYVQRRALTEEIEIVLKALRQNMGNLGLNICSESNG